MKNRIAYMQDTDGAHLGFVKDGTHYTVLYYTARDYAEARVSAKKMFENQAEAAKVYLKIAGWMLLGAYSHENRQDYLLTGTME